MGGEGEHYNTFNDGVVYGHLIMARDIERVYMPQPPLVQPGQMVSRPPQFVGRERELDQLRQLLEPRAGSGSKVGVVVGLPGVGKTALVAQAADIALGEGWFNGGHLYLDLRGYDRVPLSAHDALMQLLRDLGVPAEEIPNDKQARAARFRSELARREPVLVVLDNASGADLVDSLRPGVGQHRVLVTSRDSLPDLVDPIISLDVLSREESVELMRQILQSRSAHDTRVQEQLADATEVARLCGFLPLALRIATALLASPATKSVASLAEELAAHGARLGTLNAVRAAFDLSYQRILAEDAEAARLFRLLGLNGSPNISLAAAAAVAELPEKTTRLHLNRLTTAHLIDQGVDQSRWTMHDLMWEYSQLSVSAEPKRSREKARSRLLGYYSKNCKLAATHFESSMYGTDPLSRIGIPSDAFKSAIDWFHAERVNLVSAVEAAAEYGLDTATLELADHLSEYLRVQHRWAEKLTADRACLVVARRRRDHKREAEVLAELGFSFHQMSRFGEARDHYQQALIIHRTRRNPLLRFLIPYGARRNLGS